MFNHTLKQRLYSLAATSYVSADPHLSPNPLAFYHNYRQYYITWQQYWLIDSLLLMLNCSSPDLYELADKRRCKTLTWSLGKMRAASRPSFWVCGSKSCVSANKEWKQGARRAKRVPVRQWAEHSQSATSSKSSPYELNEGNGTDFFFFLFLVKKLIVLNLASQPLTLIHLGSHYCIICLTFSHLQAQMNKLLFNPMPTHTYSHLTPALLTVCVKWGCRYLRVSMASLLRRESPLSFPPGPEAFLPMQTLWTKPLSAAGGLYGDQ